MERIGVGFSGGMSPQDIVECVKVAEELGYESAWVAEGHGGDQFSVLTACAVATDKIKLGTSITSVFVRTPPTIAMAAASVNAKMRPAKRCRHSVSPCSSRWARSSGRILRMP